MLKFHPLLVVTLAFLVIGGVGSARSVVFLDPFTFTAGSPGDTESDLDLDVPGRQAGGSQSSTYRVSTSGHGSNAVLLEDGIAAFGPSDGLQFRTRRTSSGSQAAVDLDANFGAALAGRTWEISLDLLPLRNNAAITDSWFALSMGDVTGEGGSGVRGPNNILADFAILVRGDGRFTAWTDNVPSGGTASADDVWGEVQHLRLIVDELKAVPDVTAVFTVDGTTSTLGTWPVTWDNNVGRRFELRVHQGGGSGSGAMDVRIDNLEIVVTQDNAIPPVVLTPVAGGELWQGDSLSLSVEVGGAGPFSYRWKRNGVDIPGATGSSYELPDATAGDGGTYEVVVTNNFGSVTSMADVSVTYPTPEERSYEPLDPSSRRAGVLVSELMYHPAPDPGMRELEFIELHNSEPWATDLSGWRLSGDVDYRFPDGTVIGGREFLVVARVPGDVESNHGLTGVLGPFVGNLPNNGGRVRLRKPSGAIVWQVDYNDRHPWPLAADGAGHSLVLARPSYGEADPEAWAASHSAGGSPGAADPVPGDALDHLVINEVLANSDLPLVDFIEIHNPSPLTVDLSGCHLSDERNALTKYQFAPGTSIGPQGFLEVDETALGFALNADGETVYLVSADGSRVLDAASYPATEADVSLGLFPDGVDGGRLRPLEAITEGAANVRYEVPAVVINELFFHAPLTQPGGGDWIELHNRSAEAVDLSGWMFTNGVEFIFPAGTMLAPGGYLVVAEDRAGILANHPGLSPAVVLGDFAGSLANGGDRITLAKPDPEGGGFFIAVETVAYKDRSAGVRWADGRGSSLERRDPAAPAGHDANWADSDESAKAGWTTVEVSGRLLHGNTGVDPVEDVQFLLLGEGEVMVDQVEVVPLGGSDLVANGSFEAGDSGWSFDGNHRASVVESGDAYDGSQALRLVSRGRGDPLANRVRAPLTGSVPVSTTATLRARVRWLKGHPEFDIRLKGGWLEGGVPLEVPANLGTPGAANSQLTANAGPVVGEVCHRPLLPAAGVPFRVFARVDDPDGVQGVVLRYRIDPSLSLASVPMLDDGLNGDLLAGDGEFTARIPAQAAGSLVGFHVEATDLLGAAASVPQDPAPNGAECLVRVGESVPDSPFASYRFWITEATLADWIATPFLANDPFPATIVYGDRRVFYNGGAHYAGARDVNNSPLGTLTGYDLLLPAGEAALGTDHLSLDLPIRDPTNQREQLMYHFLDLLELPSLHRRDIQLYLNGQRRGVLYHDAEQPDGVVVDSHFPGDDGHLYKLNNDKEGTDASVRITPYRRPLLDVFLANGRLQQSRYLWNFGPRARGADSRLELDPVYELVTAADSTLPDHADGIRAIVDMENWMRTFAMNDLASFWDGFGNPNYKNTYLYKPEAAGWTLFSWDFDVGLGVFNDPVNAALFPSNIDPNIKRLYEVPEFVRSYWRTMDEALDDWFSGAALSPRLQARFDAYQAAGLSITSPFVPSGTGLSIPDWIDQRRSFLLGEFAGVDAGFAVTGPADQSSSPVAEVVLAGTAPVAAATIEVNGLPVTPEWSSVTDWSAGWTLLPGLNTLVIRALDREGGELASQGIEVEFTGGSSWPPLAINEWMADNNATVADPADGDFEDWIELHNPTSEPVDLEGWRLTDDPGGVAPFVIPAGFSIPAGGYLLVWADNEALQNDPVARPDLHVDFKLSANGESIGLHAPDGSEIDLVTFGPQAEDFSEGRSENAGDVDVLAAATPGVANASAPFPMEPALVADGGGFDLRITTTDRFVYALESSDDLVNWAPVGGPVTGTGGPHAFDLPASNGRIFVRIRRSP